MPTETGYAVESLNEGRGCKQRRMGTGEDILLVRRVSGCRQGQGGYGCRQGQGANRDGQARMQV